MKHITIYTDGACSGNPGVGGWGAVLYYGEYRKEFSGGELVTTNNRMELTAAIMALKNLREPCNVKLYSDSAYLVNAFNNDWLSAWRANNWRKSDNKPVLNVDLWETLIELAGTHSVNFIKVKGHSDNADNNRCDKLARDAIDNLRKSNGI